MIVGREAGACDCVNVGSAVIVGRDGGEEGEEEEEEDAEGGTAGTRISLVDVDFTGAGDDVTVYV